MHVLDMIFFWAKAKPNHPAIIQPGVITTYARLAEAIESASWHIMQYELDPAAPVAVSIENPAQQLIVTLALVHSGFTASPVYEGLLPQLGKAGINVLISANEGETLPGGKTIKFNVSQLVRGLNSSTQKNDDRKPTGPYGNIITFTSGTTGLPKMHVLTADGLMHRVITSAMRQNMSYSRILIVPGIGSAFGFGRTCEALSLGKTACFSEFGEAALRMVSTYRIDAIVASTIQSSTLAEISAQHAGYSLNSLKEMQIGGSFPSKDIIRRIQASLCQKVSIGYSSTEAGVVAIASYDMIENIPGAVGFVVPWAELEVVDETGSALPVNTEGFIRCRTPQFLATFAMNNADIQIDPGDIWFYPGDRGHVTEGGVLCIAGRGDDVINRGGVKLSAVAMEEILLSCDGVRDAGVCGIRDDSGPEGIWIAIVTDESFDMLVFRQQLAGSDKSFQLFSNNVDEIFSIDQIPRNELGKIKRHELKELLLNMKNRTFIQS
jgi:acyl-coenzyme A synthetase/AMP-(fatty) acid ligase